MSKEIFESVNAMNTIGCAKALKEQSSAMHLATRTTFYELHSHEILSNGWSFEIKTVPGYSNAEVCTYFESSLELDKQTQVELNSSADSYGSLRQELIHRSTAKCQNVYVNILALKSADLPECQENFAAVRKLWKNMFPDKHQAAKMSTRSFAGLKQQSS